MIDLRPFCGIDRPYITKPFSRGDFTYATNGRICIRVPRREDVPEQENHERPNILKLPWDVERAYVPLPTLSLPPPAMEECDCFDGHEHDCPGCECVCKSCNGTGERDADCAISADLLGQPFALHFIRLLAALPNARIALVSDNSVRPTLTFLFDGGAGFLISRRRPHDQHIDCPRPEEEA